MATYQELASILGYDALSPMYQALGGQGNPFYAANEEGGQGQFLDANMAQVYGFDPSFFDPYTFEFAQSGPGNSGTVSAFKDGNALGSWSQYDTPMSETLRDFALTAGAAFGGAGLAGFGPAAGMFGGGAGAGGAVGGTTGGAVGGTSLSALGGALPEFGMGTIGTGTGIGGGLGGLGGSIGGGMSSLIPGISNSQLFSVGGNLLSGLMGSNAADKASKAQLAAGRESNALQKYIFDTLQANQAPYQQAGVTALGQIQNLLANPGSITSQPDYQFGLNQGIKARDQSAASNGMLYSGAQQKALTQYGNDYAGTKLDQSYNRLANIAGIGQTANQGVSNAAQNYGNQVGNTLQGMGNSRASGYIGQSNAWGNAFGNMVNDYQQDDIYKRLGLGG
jgi:hypothetical protein